MRNIELKKQPLFQSTLGDLVEVLKEELGLSLQARVVTMKRAIPSHLVVNIMSGA